MAPAFLSAIRAASATALRRLADGLARDGGEAAPVHAELDRLRGLIDGQADIIFRRDVAGRLTFVNDVFCQTFGTSREEALGRPRARPPAPPAAPFPTWPTSRARRPPNGHWKSPPPAATTF